MKKKKTKRVSRRDFIQHTSKYIKADDLPVIITRRGEDELIIKEIDEE